MSRYSNWSDTLRGSSWDRGQDAAGSFPGLTGGLHQRNIPASVMGRRHAISHPGKANSSSWTQPWFPQSPSFSPTLPEPRTRWGRTPDLSCHWGHEGGLSQALLALPFSLYKQTHTHSELPAAYKTYKHRGFYHTHRQLCTHTHTHLNTEPQREGASSHFYGIPNRWDSLGGRTVRAGICHIVGHL